MQNNPERSWAQQTAYEEFDCNFRITHSQMST
jgi:hypothetical protein